MNHLLHIKQSSLHSNVITKCRLRYSCSKLLSTISSACFSTSIFALNTACQTPKNRIKSIFAHSNRDHLSSNCLLSRLGSTRCIYTDLPVDGLTRKIVFTEGRSMKLNHGKLSRLSDGSCLASIGDTSVLCAVVSKSSKTASSGGFMPLTVDYREKSSAAGRIPTNHLRRELAPSEREILIGRLIDRSVRPMFPDGFFDETQITCNLLSADAHNDPDIVCINAASTALALSDIVWDGPIGAVRVGLLNDALIVNPTRRELLQASAQLVITVNNKNNVLMMEGNSRKPISINELSRMIRYGEKEAALIVKEITLMQAELNIAKRDHEIIWPTQQQIDEAYELSFVKLTDILSNHQLDKQQRDAQISLVRDQTIPQLRESYKDCDSFILLAAFHEAIKRTHQKYIFDEGLRCDGRHLDQVRPLRSEVGIFGPLHGSALFQRGQTQVLGTVTFDSPDAALKLNNLGLPDEVKEKKFMLHYDFPQYATNEIRRSMGIGRREIGHGALAERAIRPLIPGNCPFTIRLTAEVLESNGSSSMASVCAGSMALMHAGIELKEHVAGVAMGLSMKPDADEPGSVHGGAETKNFRVLTDITGFEDHFGEMDFKVAGTKDGFTALQLDCKLRSGLNNSIISEAITKAVKAKLTMLDNMYETINAATKDKANLPILEQITVPVHKRAAFLGPNGFNVKRLKAEVGVTIHQDEGDVTKFSIFAPNQDAMNEANEYINEVLADPEDTTLEFGVIYNAKIVEIRPNGVMITLYPSMKPVLLHNRELDRRKVQHPSALDLEVGNEVQVKYFGRDPSSGEMRISRRVLQISSQAGTTKNLLQNEA